MQGGTRRFVGLLAALAAAGAASADVPKCLIVQFNQPKDGDNDPNVDAANYVANAVDASSRAQAIIWNLTDPIFRGLAMDGKLHGAVEKPDLGRVLDEARAQGWTYVLAFRAYRNKGNLQGDAHLYRDGRDIWKGELKNLALGGSGIDKDESSALTVANTWITKILDGPWKNQEVAVVAPTPPAAQGEAPIVVPVPPPVAKMLDNDALRKRIGALHEAGQDSAAVLTAREAVDEAPLDLDRRLILIEETLRFGRAELAANEARRAAALMPDKPELRVAAARAWLAAGRAEEARSDLNEAATRDPNAPSVRILLAETAIRDGHPDAALDHLQAALQAGPSGEASYLRALARSLLGGEDGATSDLLDADKAKYDLAGPFPRFATALLKATVADEDALKALLTRMVTRRDDAAIRDAHEDLSRKAKARASFLAKTGAPKAFGPVRDRLIFAQRLLSQALLDASDYLQTGQETNLTDARINLGEAIRQTKEAEKGIS
ncbi:hypothetical protein BH11ARM2_BH11ARM2_06020 [soil metagenome]